MLRWFLVCALIVSQARAGEEAVTARTRMIRLSTPKLFRERCGANNGHVYACTQLVGTQLTADCVAEKDLWSLRPKVSYLALMYIVRQDYIAHEERHLKDIEQSVREHLAALESQRFATAGACQSASTTAAAEFPARMQAFAAKSNAERH